ncbi:MAG TPA: hypothetical protein VFI24_01535 [Pyrinomonadaceae bacterium]|nr:hypothetical protein [Pyrinomonadaceae bacterium]
MAELRKQIKIVKRNQRSATAQSEPKTIHVELNVGITVKGWIAELKQRKQNERHSFAPLLNVVGST